MKSLAHPALLTRFHQKQNTLQAPDRAGKDGGGRPRVLLLCALANRLREQGEGDEVVIPTRQQLLEEDDHEGYPLQRAQPSAS